MSTAESERGELGDVSGRIVFVEDSLARAGQIRRLLHLFRSGDAVRSGRRLAPLTISNEEYWDPVTALQRISGGAKPDARPGVGAEIWDADDLLFMDCWDRDAMDDTLSPARSTFFALDLLRALRSVREAGGTVPRVVAHSRGMNDDLMRAALGEFCWTREQIRVPDATPVKRWRTATDRDASGAVLWAMFDRTTLERNLDRVLTGDRSAALERPGPTSPVWSQIHPTSCLASFHCAVRDECPELWDMFVIGRDAADGTHGAAEPTSVKIDAAAIARVTRAAAKYLDLNDAWGARGYKGYLAIARALANPES